MNVHSKSSKQRLLDATLELIATKGLHNSPMAKISERSRVSAGAIYNYFPNKEALINYLYLDLNKAVIEAIFKEYDHKLSYKKRFIELCKRLLDYFLSHPHQFSYIEQCSISPLISSEIRAVNHQCFAPLIEFLNEGINSRFLKNLDVELMLALLWGSIMSLIKLNLSEGANISSKQHDVLVRFCWDGLKAN